MAEPRLVLASGSPRRRELLALLGHPFQVIVPDVDETRRAGESPEAMVERLARTKAQVVASIVDSPAVVVAADTVVVLDGRVLGKPRGPADADSMLRSLSGRRHHVLTGVAIRTETGARSFVERTEVQFVEIDATAVAEYVSSGEPLDKAGAYAIQGAGGRFVDSIAGSYHNVVGLPMARLATVLDQMSSPA